MNLEVYVMTNVENKRPIFGLGFSTEILNEIERKECSIKETIKEKLDVIDKSEHLSSKDKMSKILNIRRKEENNLHIKTLVSLGLFNSYIAHCEYLIYACKKMSAFEIESNVIQLSGDDLSSYIKRIKEYDLKYIENLISQVDNSFDPEINDKDNELLHIDTLILSLLASAENVDSFDKMYRDMIDK